MLRILRLLVALNIFAIVVHDALAVSLANPKCKSSQSQYAPATPPSRSLFAFVVTLSGPVSGISASNTSKAISAAVTALDPKTTAVQTLFTMPGTYHEQAYVPSLKGPLVIQAYTYDAQNYNGNTVTIQHSQSLAQLPDASGDNAVGADDDHTVTL